jgi:hypothetical protein
MGKIKNFRDTIVTCLKINFGTDFEFLVPAIVEKLFGKQDQFFMFFAFPATHVFTK